MKFFTFLKNIFSQRWTFIFIIILTFIGIGIGTYAWYYNNKLQQQRFLTLLSTYNTNEEMFKTDWPQLVSKAKTSLQYLMILKRLDNYNLRNAYQKTLVRALTKFPEVTSLLALAIEYKLTNTDGIVFDDYLNKIDSLWEKYPNLVRLYYISLAEEFDLQHVGDDILNLFYKIKRNQYTWETLNTLYQITREPIFLFLASLQAKKEGNLTIALKLYQSINVDWQNLYPDYYSALAWSVQDVNFLRNIIEQNKNIINYIRLAQIYISLQDFRSAYDLLNEYRVLSKDTGLNSDFMKLYFWLAYYYDNNTFLSEFKDIVFLTQDPQLNRNFIIYQYKSNPKKFFAFLNSLDQFQKQELLTDNIIQFLNLNSRITTLPQQQAFLWKKLYDENINLADLQSWYKIAASFFLLNNLFEDYYLLKKNSEMKNVLLPYDFYFNIKYNTNFIQSQELQEYIRLSENIQFNWWHYYNLGLMQLNLLQFDLAQKYLEKAQTMIEYIQPENKSIILTQLVRLYLAKPDIEQAELAFNELKTLFPTNAYRFILEARIQNLKSQQ